MCNLENSRTQIRGFLPFVNPCFAADRKSRIYVTFIHFWRAGGQDYPQELFKSLNWYYDPSNFIKRLFSLGIIHFKTQIIYPNGDYVSFYDDKNKVELKRLIKSKKFVKERQKHQKIVAKRLGL